MTIINTATQHQLIKFLLIGALNTLVGYLLYAFFICLGINYPLAIFLATLLGVLFNFKTIGKIVFNNTKKNLFHKFFSVYLIAYFINLGLIKLFGLITTNLYLAGFFSLIPVAIITFTLNKYFVFKDNYDVN
ncbi:GtrA family protein [Legionella sp. D16C41]|uniref:GtrA family protein n=1 Tax=Legionella sp. D16C41 TaxID=3402688 RepID=UPI003AF9BF52